MIVHTMHKYLTYALLYNNESVYMGTSLVWLHLIRSSQCESYQSFHGWTCLGWQLKSNAWHAKDVQSLYWWRWAVGARILEKTAFYRQTIAKLLATSPATRTLWIRGCHTNRKDHDIFWLQLSTGKALSMWAESTWGSHRAFLVWSQSFEHIQHQEGQEVEERMRALKKWWKHHWNVLKYFKVRLEFLIFVKVEEVGFDSGNANHCCVAFWRSPGNKPAASL